MFDSVDRFEAFFQKDGRRAILLGSVLWTTYQKMVVPEGPVSFDYAAASDRHRNELLKYFKECALIRTGRGFVSAPEGWYCVLCDRPVALSALSQNTRSKVRRGLKNCAVRRLDARFIAGHAWPVFTAAFGRYQNSQPNVSEYQFKRNLAITEEFGDIIHYWGGFDNKTGQLIAYVRNYLCDKIEVNYASIKFHPDFLHLYTGYALFYEMNRYYLDEQNFSYVNDGFRALLHESNIQDFLIKKFLFKIQPVGLEVYYRPVVGRCVSATYPLRALNNF